MKKFLFILLGVVVSLASCSNQEDVELSYTTALKVSAANIFKSYQEVDDNDFNLSNYSNWEIELSLFVYDASGNLVEKESANFDNIELALSHELTLAPGEYKSVSIARFGRKEGNGYTYYWNISDYNTLSTLTIEEVEDGYMQFIFETLGICVKDLTITNSSQSINIDIPPVTGLLEVFFWGEDLTGFGENGYSEKAPYCQEVNIWAPNLKQKVKFENGKISYDYGVQNKEYRIAQFLPKTSYTNNLGANKYNFRAILPIEDRDFYWDIKFDKGQGSQFGYKDFQESTYTTKLNIESGKQYVLDLFLDGGYLFAQEHVRDEDMIKRKERLLKELNLMAFNQIIDRNFDTFIGQSESMIESTFGIGYTSGNSIYYYNYNTYVQALVFGIEESTNTVKTISIIFQNLNDDFREELINYLTNRFTVFEKGTDQHTKAFINASSLEDASIGITLNLDDSLLTYVKLK